MFCDLVTIRTTIREISQMIYFRDFPLFSNFCPIVIALPFILDACPKGHLGRSQKTLTQFWEDALNPIPPHLEFSPQKRCSKSKSKLGNSIALHQNVFFMQNSWWGKGQLLINQEKYPCKHSTPNSRIFWCTKSTMCIWVCGLCDCVCVCVSLFF